MDAAAVRRALAAHYTPPQQQIVFEVPNAVSGNATRYCDAMVCNFWNSRGLELEGIEIKVSRSDWQRERQMPGKAESHFERCDRWWLCTPVMPTPIAKPDEIPGPWGWLQILPTGAVSIAKTAPKLVPTSKPDYRFMLCLVRALGKGDAKDIDAEVRKRVALIESNMTEQINARAQHLIDQGSKDGAKAREVLKHLEAALRERDGGWRMALHYLDDVKFCHAIIQLMDLEAVADGIERAVTAGAAAQELLGKLQGILAELTPPKQEGRRASRKRDQ